MTVKSARNREKGKVEGGGVNLRDLPPIRDPIQIMHYDKDKAIRNSRIIDFDNGRDADNREYDRYAALFVFPFVDQATLLFSNGERQVVRRVED